MSALAGRRTSLLVAAAVAGLALLYWQLRVIAPVVLPQEVTRWNQDLYTIYYPLYAFAYRGDELLPRWNPYQLVGVPFLANYNGGLLYPANLLATVVPVHRALGYLCALHLALAGVLAFAVARALALGLAAAALCGIGFMLSGYLVVEALRPSYLAAMAWIPAIFLCAGRLAVYRRVRDALLLGVVLALQFLTGAGQAVCYAGYALLLVAPIALFQQGWHPRALARLVALALLAVVTAVLLSAAQLAPTLEVVARGVRSFQGLTLAQTLPGTPSLEALRQTVLATGLLVVPAVFALGDVRRRALVVAALVLAAFGALVGLGTPVYTHLFYYLPGVALFRLPQAMLNFTAFAIAVLAAVGLDAVACANAGWTQGRRIVLAALAAIVVLVVRPPGIALPLAAGVLAAMAVLPWLRRPRARAAVAWLVVGLVAAERLAQPGNRAMMPQNNDAAFFAAPPVVEFLRARAGHERILLIKGPERRFPLTEKLGTLYGLDVVQDFEPLAPAAVHDFLRPLEFSNVDQPLFWGRYYPPGTAAAWRLIDMLAVRYVLVAPGAPWSGDGSAAFPLIYSGPDGRVFENLSGLPRAYIVPRVVAVPSPDAALAVVHSKGFEPRTSAVIEGAPELGRAGGDAPGADEVRFERVDNDAVVLDVQSARGGLLILSDLYWPGWRVSVDGVERTIHRANGLFRGVAIDPGHHTVRFWYDPRALQVGAVMSGLTALLVAGIFGAAARRYA